MDEEVQSTNSKNKFLEKDKFQISEEIWIKFSEQNKQPKFGFQVSFFAIFTGKTCDAEDKNRH